MWALLPGWGVGACFLTFPEKNEKAGHRPSRIRNGGRSRHLLPMATPSPVRSFALPFPLAAVFAAAVAVLPSACSSDDDDSPSAPAAGSGTSATGGTGNLGGTSSVGGASARGGTGGSGSSGVGGSSSNVGGSSSSVGGSSNMAGSSSHAGGKSAGGAGSSSSSGGGTSTGGNAGPPKPNDDGSSPYERECHGDTIECNDVEVLRCLGIRDGDTIFGYSCSNTCESDAECSDAPASGEAQAACVDFVTQKHCLLVCLSDGKMHSCPDGMGCYVYPQSPIGYCLWQ